MLLMPTWTIAELKEKPCFPDELPAGKVYLCPLCGGDHDDGPWWLYPSFGLPICYGCADELLNRTPLLRDAGERFGMEPARVMVIVGDARVPGEDPEEFEYPEVIERYGIEA
jgi:hypothetical protein